MAVENIYQSSPQELAGTVQQSESLDLQDRIAADNANLQQQKLDMEKQSMQQDMDMFQMRQEQERYLNDDNQRFQEEFAKLKSELTQEEFKESAQYSTYLQSRLSQHNQRQRISYWENFLKPYKARGRNYDQLTSILQETSKTALIKLENTFKTTSENSRAIARANSTNILSGENLPNILLNVEASGKYGDVKDVNNILSSMSSVMVQGVDSLRPDNSRTFNEVFSEATELLTASQKNRGLTPDQEARLDGILKGNNGIDGQLIMHIFEDLNSVISSDAYQVGNITTTYGATGLSDDELDLKKYKKGISKLRTYIPNLYTDLKLRAEGKIPPDPKDAALGLTAPISALLNDIVDEQGNLSPSEIDSKFYEIVDLMSKTMTPGQRANFENAVLPYVEMIKKNVMNRQEIGATSSDAEYLRQVGESDEDFLADIGM